MAEVIVSLPDELLRRRERRAHHARRLQRRAADHLAAASEVRALTVERLFARSDRHRDGVAGDPFG